MQAVGAFIPVGVVAAAAADAVVMASCLRGWAADECLDAYPVLREAGFSDQQIAAHLPRARELVEARRS